MLVKLRGRKLVIRNEHSSDSIRGTDYIGTQIKGFVGKKLKV